MRIIGLSSLQHIPSYISRQASHLPSAFSRLQWHYTRSEGVIWPIHTQLFQPSPQRASSMKNYSGFHCFDGTRGCSPCFSNVCLAQLCLKETGFKKNHICPFTSIVGLKGSNKPYSKINFFRCKGALLHSSNENKLLHFTEILLYCHEYPITLSRTRWWCSMVSSLLIGNHPA